MMSGGARSTALHLRGYVLPQGDLRDLFVSAGRITFEQPNDAETVVNGAWLLPGLVDAHAHLALASPVEGSARERVRASLAQHLEAGVLVVREPGSPARDAALGLGPAEGLPRTITGGRFLAPPGRYFRGLAREVTDDELPDAAEDEARVSGAWAKVIGDFWGDDGRLAPHWRQDALDEAVRRVHALRARITTHAVSTGAIEQALAAGFDCLEHATELRSDHIAQMARRGTALVPTMTIREGIIELTGQMGMPADEAQRVIDGVRSQAERVREAYDAGVTILAGTDAGMVPHGIVASEVGNLLEAGLPPASALGAASWIARSYLGLPGIEEGAPADLVAYSDDPRGDVGVLAHPALITLAGTVVTA